MDIQIKIREYIKANGISFREFAKTCGMPNSTLQSICERGIFSASFANAKKIADVLGVSVSDFAGSAEGFSPRELGVISKFKTLDERGKNAVEAVLQSQVEYAFKGEKTFSNVTAFSKKDNASYIEISKRAEKTNARTLKVFLQPAAAGTGNYLDDDSFEEILFENPPASADFGVRIAGDSMTPQINDGDIVFVKQQATISEGEIGIYVIDGDAFCKKLLSKNGEYFLHSLNPKYSDFKLAENAFLVGKVVF
ncbi:MAG: XRE family transcriptional regulator [Bacillota bacterium]